MSLRLVFVLPLVVAACGGQTPAAEDPESAQTIVVIPEVTEEQSKKAEKEPSAPGGKRDPIAALGVSSDSSDADMWGNSGGGPTGGPDCTKASYLCLSYYAKQPTQNPDMMRICNNLRAAPSAMCSMLLTQFQQAIPGGSSSP